MSAKIGAVVLAAGMSRRMGQPKLLLPWGGTTVIGQVVSVLRQAREPLEIVVVGGRLADELRAALPDEKVAFNPDYEQGEMLASLRVGLAGLGRGVAAALVALGDQPQIEVEVVDRVIAAYRQSGARLVAPSYQMRRGHPWLIERSLWPEMLGLQAGETLRDLLARFADQIHYVAVERPSVLKDLDTPEDYQAEKPPE